jgi:hypothetical protein
VHFSKAPAKTVKSATTFRTSHCLPDFRRESSSSLVCRAVNSNRVAVCCHAVLLSRAKAGKLGVLSLRLVLYEVEHAEA